VPSSALRALRALIATADTASQNQQVTNLQNGCCTNTVNRLKHKVTMIFITHQVPKGLQVDEVVTMGQHAMHVSLVKEDV